MNEKTDEQILNEIEVHSSNAVKLLNRSHEIHMAALNLENIDAYIAVLKRAAALQELSIEEMQKAVELQNTFSQRLISLQHLKSKFGMS